MLRQLGHDDRPATADEQAVLAHWSGWGALPGVFDDTDPRWADERTRLRALLDESEWAAARRTTLNAHYTDAGVVTAMWTALGDLGFGGGRVLEPGCGTGNFIGLAPQHLALEWVGVEQDPISGRIARALYPLAEVRLEGFQDTRFPADSFDAAVGNVPFGSFRLHDPTHNSAKLSIHNHFIVKSLDLVRPGGLVAVVTSRYTLDARDTKARREIAERADLVGAVRLPAGAFRAAAGTDVIVDLLILQRRHGPLAVGERCGFAGVVDVDTPTGPVAINEWFAARPQHVLGDLHQGSGQYRADDLVVTANGNLDEQLRTALAEITTAAGRRYQPRRPIPGTAAPVAVVIDGPVGPLKEGSIHASGDGFVRIVDGAPEVFEPKPAKDRDELVALIGLRDTVNNLLAVQAASSDDDRFAVLQSELNARYDGYSARWGPINRYRLARTGRMDPESGEERLRRMRPPLGGFRADPDFPSLLALEHYDDETHSASKAAVFSRRVVAPHTPLTSADTPADALAVCLDELGRADLDRIAQLLDVDPPTAREQLGTLVFDDPTTGHLLPGGEYLSGNVRARLADARNAAKDDPRYQVNVAALEPVVPVDLEPGEIDARPGASWVPAADVAQFVEEVLGGAGVDVEYTAITAEWAIKVASWQRSSVAMTSEWGTERMDAVALLSASANQRLAAVYDIGENDRRILNPAETMAARQKQDTLNARFGQWIWEDPARAERLARRYNELFNSTVPGRFDGSHLSLPGLAVGFTPHQHQRDAVWRVISNPTALLAHSVGAGKTATMVVSALELRRLGLASKPAIVVPNHMLEQFTREAKQLYPQANLLIAGRDEVAPAQRKAFVARCAMGDWDAVVITHSAFERIPVSPERQAVFVEGELADYRAALAASKERRGLSVKKLETQIERRKTRHEELMNAAGKDDGVTFEHAGIDYLFVDEAHLFKNLGFPTRIPGVNASGSQRAEDLALKLTWLRERNPGHVATLATATPVANSVSELYVMQRYLQPDVLEAAGIRQFDAWAGNFGTTTTALELAPDGGSYRMNTRFAKFRNVPELLTMFRSAADVRTAEDLNLAVPDLEGGRPETVTVPATDELRDYVAGLVDRAEQVRNRAVTPEEDNMLAVTGDGRKAALDLRLVHEPAPDGLSKIEAVAERVAEIHHEHAARTYADPLTGDPAPRPGGLQLVFCDLGTPKPGEWSVYRELADQIAARGVPAERVRFIHDAKDDRAKAELFAACRDGRINVVIGSTGKMGVGTNVQARAVALHHVDCPWRPADLEQREGRVIRQGNQNPEVRIVRYVTEGSFDTFMWQTVERKAGFIHQITHGRTDGRHVDDVGDQALSYAEVKALATGNPLIMEKAGVDAEVAKLTRLRDAHTHDQARLARTRRNALEHAERRQQVIDRCDEALARRVDTSGEKFTMTVDGHRYRERVEAGAALAGRLRDLSTGPDVDVHVPVGELAGFELYARIRQMHTDLIRIELAGTPCHLDVTPVELRKDSQLGLVRRLETQAQSLEGKRADAIDDRATALDQAEQAARRIGGTFEHGDRLAYLQRRQAEITALLPVDTPRPDGGAPAPTPPAASPPSPPPPPPKGPRPR